MPSSSSPKRLSRFSAARFAVSRVAPAYWSDETSCDARELRLHLLEEALLALRRARRALLVAQQRAPCPCRRAARRAARRRARRPCRCRWRRSSRSASDSSPESMITVGTPAAFASSTGRTSARSSSGASTMPCTPWLMKPSTTWICCSRSSSRSGPFQMILTVSPFAVSSCAACIAPAWMVFQNSCVVPFGMTAMVNVLPAPPWRRRRAPSSRHRRHHCTRQPPGRCSRAAAAERRVVRNESLQRDEVGRRESANGEECTDGCREAAELEDDDALHVVGGADGRPRRRRARRRARDSGA